MNTLPHAVTYCIMTAKKKPKLTNQQWRQIIKTLATESNKIPGPTLSNESLEMAKAHLVDGKSQPDVANDYGVTKQNVYKTAKRVYEFYIQYVAGFPSDWEQTLITGPTDFIKKVKKMEKELHQKLLN